MAMWTFLLEILATIAIAWLFAEWYPVISTRNKKKKIQKITKKLQEYEKDFADARLFIARIMRSSFYCLASLLLCMIIFEITELSIYSQIIVCKLGADACTPLSQESINSLFFEG
jgi:hypothetical protein